MILENAVAFSSCGVYSRKLIQCPAGGEGVRDPTGKAEEALIPPRGKQVPAAEINGYHFQAQKTII
ncbi:hypothetical protein J7I93_14575 [Bacillus sp. ISL-47]|nr:hypothetical protein [Bacillus sp. ISL-47]